MKYPESMSQAERSARHEVRLLRGFYQHLAIYVVVNAAIASVNFFFHPEHLRFPFVMLGWGIGLGIHGLRVALRGRWLGRDWEESKVQALLHRGGAGH